MSNANWLDDSIQFPRLIAELETAGAFTPSVIHDLCTSMDLELDDIVELIVRAQSAWDRIQLRRLRMCGAP